MSSTPTPASSPNPWDERYGSTDGYLYGTEPNDFVREQVPPATPDADGVAPAALCIADGEGRNGVHLARLGYRVTTFDQSAVAVDKARRLAEAAGVEVDARAADAAEFDLGRDRFDLVVSVFAHMPPPIRRGLHARLAEALRPGGTLVLEAYTPDQIGRGTGGPPVPELTMTLDGLHDELVGLEIVHGAELVRSVVEGPGHTGDGAVVQVIARRP